MGNRTKLQNVRGPNTTVSNSTPNALNQLTSLASSLNGAPTSSAALDYDSGGNLAQSTSSDGSKALYTYDDNDRLTRAGSRDASGMPTHATEFVYDYAGRRADIDQPMVHRLLVPNLCRRLQNINPKRAAVCKTLCSLSVKF